MKKCLKCLIIILIFVMLMPSFVFAYEYYDEKNKSAVGSAKNEIYSLKSTYEELVGDMDDEEVAIEYEEYNTDLYFWPIGSKETTKDGNVLMALDEPETVNITSKFGATDDVSSHKSGHGGLDIGGGTKGETNIIAAKDGTVVYPTDKDKIDCPDGKLGDTCGGGYGNYVIIQHSDGNYTLYGHMFENSITVKSGDVVKAGQVIGKMGTSGDSSGPHLHFEFRLGENTLAARVDPLDYVDASNPRPKAFSMGNIADAAAYIDKWEGVGCGSSYQTDTEYIACAGYDGVITIGHGIVWEYNSDKFIKRGVTSMGHGTHVSKKIVDEIELEVLNDDMNAIKQLLADHGIDGLKDYQILALVSRSYNCGRGRIYGASHAFVDAYLKHNGKYKLDDMYSHNPSIWIDSMNGPNYAITPGDSPGLYRRRVAEWILFVTGEMDYLENGFDSSRYAW